VRKSKSLDGAYFEGLYAADPDPWGFASRDYEAGKYADTLAALGPGRSRRALEMGCSIGVFTRTLAPRCDALVATEVSGTALERARARCADLANIDFRLARRVDDGFDGTFDLMVLSEVVYYWDDTDLAAVAAAIDRALAPGGRLLLVHWLGETDYPRSGDDAVAALAARLSFPKIVERQDRTEQYRLDLWRRAAGQAAPARSHD
jgi:SAM-dependent methyltransferase